MKKSTISEKGNPFTTIGLFTVIIEDIVRLEKRISSLENILAMNYVIDQNLVLQVPTRFLCCFKI